MDSRKSAGEQGLSVKPVDFYTARFCGYCSHAKRLLDQKGVQYREIRVDLDPDKRLEMMTVTQRRSVPQIVIGAEPIGGCTELYELERSGRLDQLLFA